MPIAELHDEIPNDVSTIVDYLAARNLAAAIRFERLMFEAIENVAAMPHMGSLKKFRHKSLREIRSWSHPDFRNYLILYYPIGDGIRVLAIVHGARQLRQLLLGRLP